MMELPEFDSIGKTIMGRRLSCVNQFDINMCLPLHRHGADSGIPLSSRSNP